MHSVDNLSAPVFLARNEQSRNEFERKYRNPEGLVWDFAVDGSPSVSVPPVPQEVRFNDFVSLIQELALQFHGPHIQATGNMLGTCAYCERLCENRGGLSQNEVDHFRPRSFANHLTFEWVNMMYICRGCNRNKDDGIFGLQVDTLGFVNPREPNAEKYFGFDLQTGAPVPHPSLEDDLHKEKAERTIAALNLDRYDINEMRLNHLGRVQRDLKTKGKDQKTKRAIIRIFRRRKMQFSSLVRYAEQVDYFDT